MHSDRIAIVGMGLAYPDAQTPMDLWSNVLAGRRAFRRLPSKRMNLADYWDPDPAAVDKFYSSKAAVLRDYSFDRVSRRISAATMDATDMTHWLALDVAGRALESAGFGDGEGLARHRTGVVLGNTLTGEFSRANVMRLRWPYVRRVLSGQLTDLGWSAPEIDDFVGRVEVIYKAPFPRVTEDTLAGGLANTIAGRICNFYDFGGGGYTVDGACSSSLLSVINAAQALGAGDLDVALAGGVDLSIDPFEVIGFAKTGALAKGVMKVYDRDSNGFWPGEGAGIVVLMRESEARDLGKTIYASIAGWGMSSDGRGGITRPEVAGHQRALAQAYARAGYGPETVGYFEGHGTGTAVGDATEIRALASTRDGIPRPVPAALSSVKANIGHTKAAAGVAGLIKAAMAVHHQVIPPATGHDEPHPDLVANAHALHVPDRATSWPEDLPIRAGVSAMGFGGINTHIALESAERPRPRAVPPITAQTVNARQDAEVLLFDGDDIETLLSRTAAARELLELAAFCELTDLAVSLQRDVSNAAYRLGVVATSPEEAVRRLRVAEAALKEGLPANQLCKVGDASWFRSGHRPARLAFAFPGQGAGIGTRGAVARRYYPDCGINDRDSDATDVVQPRIVKRSLQAMEVLRSIGVDADVAVGHSLGEMTALAWAGCLEYQAMERIAAERGRLMAELIPPGAMAVLGADSAAVAEPLAGTGAVISGFNAPALTVIAGEEHAVTAACERAEELGIRTTRLSVEHAFHTSACAEAAAAFARVLDGVPFGPVGRSVVSTATGEPLDRRADLASHLPRQLVDPVRFTQAVDAISDAELVIELGPGSVLSGLISLAAPEIACVSANTDSASLASMMEAVAAAFALGRVADTKELYRNRLYRKLELGQSLAFLESPCETAPDLTYVPSPVTLGTPTSTEDAQAPDAVVERTTLQVLRETVAAKVDLPLDVIQPDTSPLDDLHMSSITVGQVVNDVMNTLKRGHLAGVPAFATATLAEIAAMLDDLSGEEAAEAGALAGVGPWVRAFAGRTHRETLRKAPSTDSTAAAQWRLVGEPSPEAEALTAALRRLPRPTRGIVLSTEPDEENLPVPALLDALAALEEHGPQTALVVLSRGGNSGAALAKTVFLEQRAGQVTVVQVPLDVTLDGDLLGSICGDVATNGSFLEVHYPDGRTRETETWSALPLTGESTPYLGEQDVILATGGGKGITAECALSLAAQSGAALALLGRAPTNDAAVAKTLQRARALGLRHCYVRADVAVAEDVADALSAVAADLGPITAIVHGAGRNEPRVTSELSAADFETTIGPKVIGLRNILRCVDPDRLRLLTAFTSIIGRAGLHGEAHYATANSWLTNDVLEFGRAHPDTRVRSIEWSVWSGAGMGERLGVVESLQRNGIEPIPADWGVAFFLGLVNDPEIPDVVVAAGRTGSLPTFPLTPSDPPMRRFLEQVPLHYPGVEIGCEASLSIGKDLYLADHDLDGDLLFPAVMGLEAMAQAAAVLDPTLADGLAFEDVEFARPIVVPQDGDEVIRIAALRERDAVRVAIRSAATGFAVDHFRAAIVSHVASPDQSPVATSAAQLHPLALHPGRELYGGVLFQGRRFQRLANYRVATARTAVAELGDAPRHSWFAAFLPQELILADPGARDAMMHSIQCCVPHATLLPEGVKRIVPALYGRVEGSLLMEARELNQHDQVYTYGLTCFDAQGAHAECWDGLRLHAVRHQDPHEIAWVPALAASFLQRDLERYGTSVEVAVEPHPAHGQEGRRGFQEITEWAVKRLRPEAKVQRRGDGRLLVDAAQDACSAHHERFTIAVMGDGPIAVDTEPVVPRDALSWQGLLGSEWELARQISTATGCSFDDAATRVWGAMECVRKAGHQRAALTLGKVEDGRVVIHAGSYAIVTWVLRLNEDSQQTMFAILGGRS